MEAAGRDGFANPSSQHSAGRRAKRILEDARERILAAVGCRPSGLNRCRLVFTSGATEANRLAVLGTARSPAGVVAVSARDHASLRAAAKDVALRPGWSITDLPLDSHGMLDSAAVSAWLDQTQGVACRILCTTPVCGQTGSAESACVVAAAAERACLVHADATQAVAFTAVDFTRLGAATLTLAAHKFGGPRGIGGLVIRGDVDLQPLHPGPQETGMRGGTEPVALAAGFATALELASAERADAVRRVTRLRDHFEAGMRAIAERRGIVATVISETTDRSPHISTIGFHGRDRQAIVMAADLGGLCCATGTACASGSSEPSPALASMGLPADVTRGAVRFSFGGSTTEADINRAITILETVLS